MLTDAQFTIASGDSEESCIRRHNQRREAIAVALMPWALAEEWGGRTPTCTPKDSAKNIHETAAYHACDAAEFLMAELDRRAK